MTYGIMANVMTRIDIVTRNAIGASTLLVFANRVRPRFRAPSWCQEPVPAVVFRCVLHLFSFFMRKIRLPHHFVGGLYLLNNQNILIGIFSAPLRRVPRRQWAACGHSWSLVKGTPVLWSFCWLHPSSDSISTRLKLCVASPEWVPCHTTPISNIRMHALLQIAFSLAPSLTTLCVFFSCFPFLPGNFSWQWHLMRDLICERINMHWSFLNATWPHTSLPYTSGSLFSGFIPFQNLRVRIGC